MKNIINQWLNYGGVIVIDQMTNSLYVTQDEDEIDSWYNEREKDFADMSKDDYLKHLCRNALRSAKIDEEKIEKYLAW